MRRTLQATVAVGIGLVVTASATSAAEQPRKPSTLSGSCEFSGIVRFEPPLTATPQEVTSRAVAEGPCTGTWRHGNKVFQLDGDHVRYRAQGTATQGCDSAEATGEGFLSYRRKKLRFAFSESRLLTTAEVHLDGAAGGAFDGEANASGDPAAAVQACFGPGLTESPITLSGATSPEMSG
jgi:hypothetical protein